MRTSDRRQPGRPRRPGWRTSALVALAVLAGVAASLPAVEGGFTAGLGNRGTASGTGSLQLSAASGGTTECSTSIATPSATCTGTLTPSGVLPTGGTSTSLTTTVTDTGSLRPTTTTLTQGACGPIPFANASTTGDPMLVRGGVTAYAATGPLLGGTSISLDGTSGQLSDIAGSTWSATSTFTEVVWFRASGTAGGVLLGASNTAGVSPSSWDKMLWLDTTGHVVFGVYTGGAREVTSTLAYNDGLWHMAAGTVSATGQSLSVDGVAVGTANAAVTTSQSYGLYWHAGWDNVLNGWTNPPASAYLAGSLADAAVFPALTTTQQLALAKSSSQAVWDAYVAGTGSPAAIQSWTLGDQPTGVWTGSAGFYTAGTTGAPCAFVDATVQTTVAGSTTCAAPAAATGCGVPGSTTTLGSLAGTTVTLQNPTPSAPLTVTVTLARDATRTVAATPSMTGLHLNLTDSVNAVAGSFTAQLGWPPPTQVQL